MFARRGYSPRYGAHTALTAVAGVGTRRVDTLHTRLRVFMLLERRDLRDRVIGLLGHGQQAGTRVSRQLLMQSLVNLLYGIAADAGLYSWPTRLRSRRSMPITSACSPAIRALALAMLAHLAAGHSGGAC